MPQPTTASDPMPYPVRTPILTLAILLALAALLGASPAVAATKTNSVAKTTEISTIGKTVLTTNRGRTLYSLSAETNGKLICKRGCLIDWHPLYIAKGVKPTGPVKLGTIKRPDTGKRQVTFKGRPLYTFDEDARAGDVKGEGIRDVGVWRAAAP